MNNENWVSKQVVDLKVNDIFVYQDDPIKNKYIALDDYNNVPINLSKNIKHLYLSFIKRDIEKDRAIYIINNVSGDNVYINSEPVKQDVGAILDRVKTILTERGKQYDKDSSQERSMAKVVSLFNQLTGSNLTELQGWQFMEIVKLVRYWENPENNHEDSLIDGIGYSALKAECALNKKD